MPSSRYGLVLAFRLSVWWQMVKSGSDSDGMRIF